MKYLLITFSLLLFTSCHEEVKTFQSLTPASAKLIFELNCSQATPPLKTFLEEKSSKNKEWKLLKYFKLRVSNIKRLRYILDQAETIHLIETNHAYDLKAIYKYLEDTNRDRPEFTFNEILFENQVLYQFSRKDRQISLHQIHPQLIIAGSNEAIFKCLQLSQEDQPQKDNPLHKKLSQSPKDSIAQLISSGSLAGSSTWPILKSISRIEATLSNSTPESISLEATISLDKNADAEQFLNLSKSLLAFTSLPPSLNESLQIKNELNSVQLEASLTEADLIQINLEQKIKDQKRAAQKQSSTKK